MCRGVETDDVEKWTHASGKREFEALAKSHVPGRFKLLFDGAGWHNRRKKTHPYSWGARTRPNRELVALEVWWSLSSIQGLGHLYRQAVAAPYYSKESAEKGYIWGTQKLTDSKKQQWMKENTALTLRQKRRSGLTPWVKGLSPRKLCLCKSFFDVLWTWQYQH